MPPSVSIDILWHHKSCFCFCTISYDWLDASNYNWLLFKDCSSQAVCCKEKAKKDFKANPRLALLLTKALQLWLAVIHTVHHPAMFTNFTLTLRFQDLKQSQQFWSQQVVPNCTKHSSGSLFSLARTRCISFCSQRTWIGDNCYCCGCPHICPSKAIETLLIITFLTTSCTCLN